MKAKSKYAGLNYLVQSQTPGEVAFETTAAFRRDWEAIEHAKDCLKDRLAEFTALNTGEMRSFGWRFRVLRHVNNEPKCIYRSDADAAV